MSMSIDETLWYLRYARASNDVQKTVDRAYDHVRKVLTNNGIAPANDDRAEILVSAIMRYLIESQA